METLDYFLSLVTDEPVTLSLDAASKAFPGTTCSRFGSVVLAAGFEVGDFMHDSTASVAQELVAIDVSSPGAGTSRRQYAVWRVALKTGPVALMLVKVAGEEGADSSLTITGFGHVINDPELEPFLAQRVIETARREAFLEIESIEIQAAKLTAQFDQLFPEEQQRAVLKNRIRLSRGEPA